MNDIDTQLDKFIDQNRMYHWEGSTGVRNLEHLVKAIGYNDNYGDAIRNFLCDNPGAIEAMVEWIRGSRCKDWAEMLAEEVSTCDE
jgi:hypothetical protein